MKFIIVLFALTATAMAVPLSPGVLAGFAKSAAVAHVQNDIAIINSAYDLLSDGTYNYEYKTGNGIVASENGIGGKFAKGSVEYTSPEGEHVALQYTADENGYQPSGSHILPIPDYIIRSLEYTRTHPHPEYQ